VPGQLVFAGLGRQNKTPSRADGSGRSASVDIQVRALQVRGEVVGRRSGRGAGVPPPGNFDARDLDIEIYEPWYFADPGRPHITVI